MQVKLNSSLLSPLAALTPAENIILPPTGLTGVSRTAAFFFKEKVYISFQKVLAVYFPYAMSFKLFYAFTCT